MFKFKIGDRVRKAKGYSFEGIVVSDREKAKVIKDFVDFASKEMHTLGEINRLKAAAKKYLKPKVSLGKRLAGFVK